MLSTGMTLRKRAPRESEKPDAPLLLIQVFWAKHRNAGAQVAQFQIRVEVYFEEGDYNYGNWQYQQEAYDETTFRAGKGAGAHTVATWDDKEPYTAGWSEVGGQSTWVFTDQPGYSKSCRLAEDSDIDYKFAAKWKVWNTKTGQEVNLGPYYGRITGAHPRTYSPDEGSLVSKRGKVTVLFLNGLVKANPEGCPW